MRLRSRALLVAALSLGVGSALRADEALPPAPQAHFNDYAGVVSAGDAQRLDAKLAEFEQQTSTQLVVVVFPKLPSPSLEDFTVRAAEAWKVGQKKLDNGAILFVFVADRKLRIETGYGLEGALPDALAGRILDEQVKPRLRQGDWAGGLEAGIDGMIAATKGEYKASAATSSPQRRTSPVVVVVLILFVLLFLWLTSRRGPLERSYGSRGWRGGGWGGGWGGGGWSGGGGGGWGGGGGGFSGGGGSFGGGGASSSW